MGLREIKQILIDQSENLKCNNLLILTDDVEEKEKVKGKIITFIPVWKWIIYP
ncbi:MAG: hypothetical protein AB1765_03090 [Candidatus Hydrogenedentota bacterium]